MVQEDVSSSVLADPHGVRRQGTHLEASLEGCPSLSTRAQCMGRFTLAADTKSQIRSVILSLLGFLACLLFYSNRGH